MVVNDNAGNLIPRGVWSTIASLLAPTDIYADCVNTEAPC